MYADIILQIFWLQHMTEMSSQGITARSQTLTIHWGLQICCLSYSASSYAIFAQNLGKLNHEQDSRPWWIIKKLRKCWVFGPLTSLRPSSSQLVLEPSVRPKSQHKAIFFLLPTCFIIIQQTLPSDKTGHKCQQLFASVFCKITSLWFPCQL